jgi:hypothetical protein
MLIARQRQRKKLAAAQAPRAATSWSSTVAKKSQNHAGIGISVRVGVRKSPLAYEEHDVARGQGQFPHHHGLHENKDKVKVKRFDKVRVYAQPPFLNCERSYLEKGKYLCLGF